MPSGWTAATVGCRRLPGHLRQRHLLCTPPRPNTSLGPPSDDKQLPPARQPLDASDSSGSRHHALDQMVRCRSSRANPDMMSCLPSSTDKAASGRHKRTLLLLLEQASDALHAAVHPSCIMVSLPEAASCIPSKIALGLGVPRPVIGQLAAASAAEITAGSGTVGRWDRFQSLHGQKPGQKAP